MTAMEEKSLLAQIQLLKDIKDADSMIIYTVQSTASQVLNEVIKPKMYTKDGQTTVELTVEEFTKIRVALARLSSDEGFGEMNGWIKEKHIEPKKEKQKILSMLQ